MNRRLLCTAMTSLLAVGLLSGCNGFFAAEGEMIAGTGDCLLFQSRGGEVFKLDTDAGLSAGDRVFVIGQLDLDCTPTCGDQQQGCLVNVIVFQPGEDGPGHGRLFRGCGTLIQGAECVLFEADDERGTFVLSDQGDFKVGDRVRVIGKRQRNCVSTCMEGDGCIRVFRIEDCTEDEGGES